MSGPEKFGLDAKFAGFEERWRPKTVARLNGQEVKLVRVEGAFPWHSHGDADEMFLVWRGRVRLEFREGAVELGEGEALVVPRGLEHRPVAEAEAQLLLFEPEGVRNTGNVEDETFTAPTGATV